jgi:hypothetical protein
VVVSFANVADKKPPQGTVIAIGRLRFEPDLGEKRDRGVLAPVPIGSAVALAVYPDGRSGNRIAVPLRTRASSENTLTVVLSDYSVFVSGKPVGAEPRRYPRF